MSYRGSGTGEAAAAWATAASHDPKSSVTRASVGLTRSALDSCSARIAGKAAQIQLPVDSGTLTGRPRAPDSACSTAMTTPGVAFAEPLA